MTNIRNALMQAAGSASGDKVYVEDVFATHLYTGDAESFNTINNGIDLAGEGGLVWIKERSSGGGSHKLLSTDASGNHSGLLDSTSGSAAGTGYQPQYFIQNNNGFKTTSVVGDTTVQGNEYASWTFRIQEGFFDIATWTGNGSGSDVTISHNLGSTPGMIIVKSTSHANTWSVYHAGAGNTAHGYLSDTDAFGSGADWSATSTTFNADDSLAHNDSGKTYIAYLFASGNDSASQIFGDNGDEAIIKTGSYTGTGNTSLSVNLGFEPQWLLIKASSGGNAGSQYWAIYDVMRGWGNVTGSTKYLAPNLSSAEATWWDLQPTSTGFASTADSGNRANESGTTYIYMAIRRGPMKEPSAGTDVYNYQTRGGGGSGPPAYIFPHPVDMFFQRELGQSDDWYSGNRLIGLNVLKPDETDTLASQTFLGAFDYQNGFGAGSGTASAQIAYSWRRYPKVFDMVFYEGTGSTRTVTHNLGVAPEMMIIKNVEQTYHWEVYHSAISPADGLYLSDTGAASGASFAYASTQPTASVFTVGSGAGVNSNTKDHIAFLFASLNGISKVGTYTGTGSAINVDCGFSGGARWVMVKRTDATADWYIVSSGRGFGNHLKVDSDADESSTAVLDTLSAGFTVRSDAGNDLNASGGTYIYLAFA